ncbi:MAG: calcium-binding protein, partial [Sphingorhabdus sp.]
MPQNKSLRIPIGRSPNFLTNGGSGIMIGDGVMLTAGHVMYEFNEKELRADRAIRTIAGATLFWDPRDYLSAYKATYDAFPASLPVVTDPRLTISSQFIESQLRTKDIVFVNFGGNVRSSDAGLVTYLTPSDVTTDYFGLVAGTKYKRWGTTTGEKEVRQGYLSLNTIGLEITDPQAITQPGDSGGGNWIEFESREFILGNNVSSNLTTRSQSSYISQSEFYELNRLLEGQQAAGDKTADEPTNLIVGSSGADGSDSAPINGSFRADIVLGRDGKDVLNDGDAAKDTVYADDQLFGGAGDDHLIVGAGNNLIHGGDFRQYGGTARVALADDGTDTADFGGVTNGVEIRFPAVDAANPGSATIDTRYQTLLGNDFNSALFVKSRNISSSNEPQFSNTLVSIEKIKGSETSDVLYLGEAAQTGGAITEIDFGGENANGYPGGDVIVLGWKDKKIDARLTDKENQTLSGIGGLKLKNAESIIATAKDDEIHAAAGGFVIAGKGNDKIHLQAGTFAIGGEGIDEFYVKTKYDGSDASFNNDVFILDFKPGEDKLFVDGVLFTGYQKYTEYALLAEGPNERGRIRRYWAQNLTSQSTSSFVGLEGVDINSQTYLELAGGGAAYQDGKIRNITVAELDDGTYENLGRVQFIDVDVAFNQQNPTREQAEVLGSWANSSVDVLPGYTLNNFLNLHIGKIWVTGQEAFRHSITGDANGDHSIYLGTANTLPILKANVVEGDDGVGGPPSNLIEEFTGFKADRLTYSITSWNESQQATVRVLSSSDLSGGLGIDPSLFAAAFSSGEGGTVTPSDEFSFIYDDQLKVTLPIDLSNLDFSGDYARLGSFDLSQASISAFSNTLVLRDMGVLPEKSVSVTGAARDGRAKIAADGDENLLGTNGSDLLIGGSGDNILSSGNSNFFNYQSDILVGGAGDDIYNFGGAFDKSIVMERLDPADEANGFDVLYLDFASTDTLVIEGSNPDDVRLFLPPYIGEDGEGFADPNRILTIANQLSVNSDDWIEQIRFSDGVTWTRQQLIDQIVSIDEFFSFGAYDDAPNLVSLEDFSFAEPMSSYMFDRLRRDVTYSVTLSDGNPAPAWIKIYQ